MDYPTDHVVGDEPILPAIELIYNWRSTWLRSIARAWIDPDFKNLLLRDAKEAFREMGYDGVAKTPDGREVDLWSLLEINVEPTDGSSTTRYHPPQENQNYDRSFKYNGWLVAGVTGVMKMHLKIFLPDPPEEKWQALAISDYEAAGRVYPITGF